jgi:hypothetical protein
MRIAMVGVPWYKKEDYETLKALFVDAHKLPASYEKWLDLAEDLIDNFRRKGQAFRKVYIDPNTFPAWCTGHGLNIDAEARVQFANETVAAMQRDQNG